MRGREGHQQRRRGRGDQRRRQCSPNRQRRGPQGQRRQRLERRQPERGRGVCVRGTRGRGGHQRRERGRGDRQQPRRSPTDDDEAHKAAYGSGWGGDSQRGGKESAHEGGKAVGATAGSWGPPATTAGSWGPTARRHSPNRRQRCPQGHRRQRLGQRWPERGRGVRARAAKCDNGATECAPSLLFFFFLSFSLFISLFITNYCVLPQQLPSTREEERAGPSVGAAVPQPPRYVLPLFFFLFIYF